MSLIQFTRNHTDHSTDKGYQFEFFCDRCGNGFVSGFQPSAIGLASSAARTLGNLFGGVLGSMSGSTYEIERAVQGPGHDKAFREAIEEAKPNFRQCDRVDVEQIERLSGDEGEDFAVGLEAAQLR